MNALRAAACLWSQVNAIWLLRRPEVQIGSWTRLFHIPSPRKVVVRGFSMLIRLGLVNYVCEGGHVVQQLVGCWVRNVWRWSRTWLLVRMWWARASLIYLSSWSVTKAGLLAVRNDAPRCLIASSSGRPPYSTCKCFSSCETFTRQAHLTVRVNVHKQITVVMRLAFRTVWNYRRVFGPRENQ
jgi:hypothetical protein